MNVQYLWKEQISQESNIEKENLTMETIINCSKNKFGNHNFYITYEGRRYYLFTQNYHRGVNVLFETGVSLSNAMNAKTAKGDYCIMKTMSKFRSYIRYVERENNIQILKATKEKNEIRKHRKEERININDYDLDELLDEFEEVYA